MAKWNSGTHRRCNVCKDTKMLSEFPKHKGRPFNKGYRCKKCCSKQSCELILKRFGSFRAANLFRWYGITQEDYDRMYEEQKGKCLICLRERTLVVDHNHTTGQVRGLLCSGCNTGIGQFEHDIALFDKAKEYVSSQK